MYQDSPSLDRLINDVSQRLKDLGYTPHTIHNHQRVWQNLLCWSQKQGIQCLNEEIAAKFLKSFDIPLGRSEGRLRPVHQQIRTSVRILEEFALHGCWQRRRSIVDKICFPPTFEAAAKGFLEYCQNQGISQETLYIRRRHLLLFTSFLESQRVKSWADINPRIFPAFFALHIHWQAVTLAILASNLRGFLKYLWLQELCPNDLSSFLPHYHIQNDMHIPSVWRREDLDAILAVVDRKSPLGKRDYAILLLATRLGLRAGEIRTLKLENIHWEKTQLEVNQSKTGNRVVLPLSEEVGQALTLQRNIRGSLKGNEDIIRDRM